MPRRPLTIIARYPFHLRPNGAARAWFAAKPSIVSSEVACMSTPTSRIRSPCARALHGRFLAAPIRRSADDDRDGDLPFAQAKGVPQSQNFSTFRIGAFSAGIGPPLRQLEGAGKYSGWRLRLRRLTCVYYRTDRHEPLGSASCSVKNELPLGRMLMKLSFTADSGGNR
jgi:hypothetical protein